MDQILMKMNLTNFKKINKINYRKMEIFQNAQNVELEEQTGDKIVKILLLRKNSRKMNSKLSKKEIAIQKIAFYLIFQNADLN